jgi:glycerate kinase
MAEALGYRLLDPSGAELRPGGEALSRLARIVPPEPPAAGAASAEVTAVADVRSPLLGPDGAARRFGPQKGATPEQVEILENGLANLATRIRMDLDRDVANVPGAGAAGGLGAGCAAFLGAAVVGGSDWVLDALAFDDALRDADVVVTGEGEYDATSGLGKIVWEIMYRAERAGKPVLLTCARCRGAPPPGVILAEGEGGWLEPADLTRMVANALS